MRGNVPRTSVNNMENLFTLLKNGVEKQKQKNIKGKFKSNFMAACPRKGVLSFYCEGLKEDSISQRTLKAHTNRGNLNQIL